MSLHRTRAGSLKPFDPSRTMGVRALEVRLHKPSPEEFRLLYVLDAGVQSLHIAKPRAPRRRDELWRHTCFELFIRKGGGAAGYYELNVSPSTEWALYSFDGYHMNRTSMEPVQPPRVRVSRDDNVLRLDIGLDLRGFPHADEVAPAAVLEEVGGDLGYWALRHPSARPDFHHPDGFSRVDSWRTAG